MGSIIAGSVIVIIGLMLGIYSLSKLSRHIFLGIFGVCISLFILLIGGVGAIPDGIHEITHTGDYAKKAPKKHESKSSSKSQSSSDDEEKLTESEQKETHKLKMKNIADQLNNQFSQHEELSGWSIKPDGSYFAVTVPDSVATDSDNAQKEAYSSCSSLIDKAMHQQGTPVYFFDSNGHELAHLTWSGNIKMK